MRKVSSVIHFIDILNDRLGKIFSFIIVVMIGIMMWEVTLRYVFTAPTKWASEMTGYIFGAHFMLGGAFVLLYGAHINMDALYSRFSLRGKAILDVITFPLFLFLAIVLVWNGWEFFTHSMALREHSVTMAEIPYYPFKLMIPLGGFLLLLQGLVKFTRDLTTAIRGKQIL